MNSSQNLQLRDGHLPFVKGIITGIICFLFSANMVFSQDRNWEQPWYYAPSDKGSWKVTTDISSRKTKIEFFDLDHKLIFEEEFHGKWLRLTKKNQKALDAFLLQILPNGHLADRLSTEELPVPHSSPSSKKREDETGTAEPKYEASVHINELDKIYIAVQNELNLPCKIEVYGRSGQQLYKEYNSIPVYRRKIDVSMVSEPTYKVLISINDKQHVYYLSQSRKNAARQNVISDADKAVFYPTE